MKFSPSSELSADKVQHLGPPSTQGRRVSSALDRIDTDGVRLPLSPELNFLSPFSAMDIDPTCQYRGSPRPKRFQPS